MVEVVQMSLKEVDRYAVIRQVVERTMAQSDAALWLNISVCQVKRLVRAIRQNGAQGAVSKRWGVPSNRRISATIRDRFVGLVRAHYADFGPTLACEYLTARHGYTGSAETLRGWMMEAGLCKAKRSRVRRIHSLTLPPKAVVLKPCSKYDQGVEKCQTNRFEESTRRNSSWRLFARLRPGSQ